MYTQICMCVCVRMRMHMFVFSCFLQKGPSPLWESLNSVMGKGQSLALRGISRPKAMAVDPLSCRWNQLLEVKTFLKAHHGEHRHGHELRPIVLVRTQGMDPEEEL